jgi:hypothetical protein
VSVGFGNSEHATLKSAILAFLWLPMLKLLCRTLPRISVNTIHLISSYSSYFFLFLSPSLCSITGKEVSPRSSSGDAPSDTSSSSSASSSSGSNLLVPSTPESRYREVLAVPLPRRPLFPGGIMPVTIQNNKLIKELVELKRQGWEDGAAEKRTFFFLNVFVGNGRLLGLSLHFF